MLLMLKPQTVAYLALAGAALMLTPAHAQEEQAAPTSTPKPRRQIITAPVPTPPGYRGRIIQGARAVVAPKETAAAKATATPEAKAGLRLPKPAQVTAIVAGPESVEVSWQHDAARATTVSLERAKDPVGPWSSIAELPAARSNFTDQGSVTAGATYYYRIINYYEGYDGGIVSPLSSPVDLSSGPAASLDASAGDTSTTSTAPDESTTGTMSRKVDQLIRGETPQAR